jgi:predicted metallopeptidase
MEALFSLCHNRNRQKEKTRSPNGMAKILNKAWKEQRKKEPGVLTKEQMKRMKSLTDAKFKMIKEKLLKIKEKKRSFIETHTKHSNARRRAKLGKLGKK